MKKKILITGGASGLGKSLTEALCRNSEHEVYFTYLHSAEAAVALTKTYPNAHALKVDLCDKAQLNNLVQQLKEIDLDVLVNNALPFKMDQKHFHKADLASFTNGFMFNVLPVIALTQEAIALFRKKKNGKIITVLSSYVINKPPIGFSEYTAAKAYLMSLAKSWANEYAAFNITSNCISPSFMLTGLSKDTDERIIEESQQKHPLKRLLTTNEAAEVVVYLVGASSHVNGLNMVINAAENIN